MISYDDIMWWYRMIILEDDIIWWYHMMMIIWWYHIVISYDAIQWWYHMKIFYDGIIWWYHMMISYEDIEIDLSNANWKRLVEPNRNEHWKIWLYWGMGLVSALWWYLFFSWYGLKFDFPHFAKQTRSSKRIVRYFAFNKPFLKNGWCHMMISYDDIIRWYHMIISCDDIVKWYHITISSDDIIWWYHMMVSYDDII